MGAWITLFGAIAGYGLWHWLRIKEEKTLHNWGHARQEPSPPERLDATPIGSETAALRPGSRTYAWIRSISSDWMIRPSKRHGS
jgi:hypothetical protein